MGATFKQAISAGGKETITVADQFWGDRDCTFSDPFGHTRGVATRQEELTKDEVEQRAKDFFAIMANRKTA